MHCIHASLSVFFPDKLDLNHSFRMSLEETDSLDFSDTAEFISHPSLEGLKVFIIDSFLGVDYVLDNNYLKSLTFILNIIIPGKLLLFYHFSLDFLCQTLLLQLTRLVLILLLCKLSFFNFDSKTTPNFFFIEILNSYINTFSFCVWNSCITLWKTILVLVYFDLFFSCVEINSKNSCFYCEIFEFFFSDILRQSRDVDKSVDLGLIPLFLPLFSLPFGLFSIPLLLQELFLSKFFFWFLFLLFLRNFLPNILLIIKEKLILQLIQ